MKVKEAIDEVTELLKRARAGNSDRFQWQYPDDKIADALLEHFAGDGVVFTKSAGLIVHEWPKKTA